MGEVAKARAAFEPSLAIRETVLRQDQPAPRRDARQLRRAPPQAAGLAISGYETAGGVDNPTLWRPLTALARAKIGQAR